MFCFVSHCLTLFCIFSYYYELFHIVLHCFALICIVSRCFALFRVISRCRCSELFCILSHCFKQNVHNFPPKKSTSLLVALVGFLMYVSRLSSTWTITPISPDRTQQSIAISLPPQNRAHSSPLPYTIPTRSTQATN